MTALDGETEAASDADLPPTEVHDVLRNDRRRMVLELLGDADGPVSARELSESIAAREAGETPAPRSVRQSVYISLQQTHLPKLDDLDVVDYDEHSKEVRPGDRAAEVGVYMEVVPRYGLAWSEVYAGLGVLGLLLVAAAELDVPGVAAVGPAVWAAVALLAVVAAAAYQTYDQRSSLVHRLRDR